MSVKFDVGVLYGTENGNWGSLEVALEMEMGSSFSSLNDKNELDLLNRQFRYKHGAVLGLIQIGAYHVLHSAEDMSR